MKKDDLVKALKIVLPGVDTKNTLLEGANTFIFEGDWIKTFNDHLSVSYPLKTDLNCAVRAEEFYAVVNRMAGPELEFIFNEDKLTVKDAVTTLVMSTLKENVGKYIDNLNLESVEWFPLPVDFSEGILRCLFSAATDPIYGALNSIYVGGKDILSSDNFRISWFRMAGDDVQQFLMPVGAARELIKMGAMKNYALADAWIHFTDANEVTFSCRRMLGQFPVDNIKSLFDGDMGKKYRFPEEIAQSLDRVSVLTYTEDNKDQLDFIGIQEEKGNLIIKGERSYGYIEDKIKLPKDSFPKGVKILVAPKFLKAILPNTKEFSLKDGQLIIFSTEKYNHLISTISK